MCIDDALPEITGVNRATHKNDIFVPSIEYFGPPVRGYHTTEIYQAGLVLYYPNVSDKEIIRCLTTLDPTTMFVPPVHLSDIYRMYQEELKTWPKEKYNEFLKAIETKREYMHSHHTLYHTKLDREIFYPLKKKIVGSRLRSIVYGASSLPEQTFNFMKVVFCIPIYNSYGSNEAKHVALGDVLHSWDCAGVPYYRNKFKIEYVPDLDKVPTDEKKLKVVAQGEVLSYFYYFSLKYFISFVSLDISHLAIYVFLKGSYMIKMDGSTLVLILKI